MRLGILVALEVVLGLAAVGCIVIMFVSARDLGWLDRFSRKRRRRG